MFKPRPYFYTRVSQLCCLCAAVLGGLLLARKWSFYFTGGWLLLGGPILILGWKWRRVLPICVVVVGLAVGMQRASVAQAQLAGYQSWVGQTIIMTGHVRDDPVYDQKHQIDFHIDKVRIAAHSVPGQVRIRSPTANGLKRGDFVQVRGKLRDGFGNYQASLSFAQVQITGRNNDVFEQLRRRFFTGVYNALPDPGASLGLGFLVGLRSGLPHDLQQQLQLLALTHIVVASGYNLTILVRMSRRLLAHSRFQAFAGSCALIASMVVATGLSPSMSRAGLVTLLSLATWYYGRTIHPILILLFSAAVTAWINPLYLWSDLGWWLSFLAFAGVLLVAPLLTHRLYGSNKEPPFLARITIETVAAQLLVEPLIMLVFGQFSVLGLLANIVVVPFIPFAMLGTFAAGIAGMLLPTLAGWVALPAHMVLTYIVETVRLLAGVSWAARPLALSWPILASFYVVVLAAGVVMYRRSGFCYRHQRSVIE